MTTQQTAVPQEGQSIRFFPIQNAAGGLQKAGLLGVFCAGVFWVDRDGWEQSEVRAWAPCN